MLSFIQVDSEADNNMELGLLSLIKKQRSAVLTKEDSINSDNFLPKNKNNFPFQWEPFYDKKIWAFPMKQWHPPSSLLFFTSSSFLASASTSNPDLFRLRRRALPRERLLTRSFILKGSKEASLKLSRTEAFLWLADSCRSNSLLMPSGDKGVSGVLGLSGRRWASETGRKASISSSISSSSTSLMNRRIKVANSYNEILKKNITDFIIS